MVFYIVPLARNGTIIIISADFKYCSVISKLCHKHFKTVVVFDIVPLARNGKIIIISADFKYCSVISKLCHKHFKTVVVFDIVPLARNGKIIIISADFKYCSNNFWVPTEEFDICDISGRILWFWLISYIIAKLVGAVFCQKNITINKPGIELKRRTWLTTYSTIFL